MQTPAASPWMALGGLIGVSLVIVWMARMCHRLVHCPHCGAQSRHYVGFFSEWRNRAREIGPVRCKHCHTRFVFMA
jgi:hypothetical protein